MAKVSFSKNPATTAPIDVAATVAPVDTSEQPVDENAAERKACEMEAPAAGIPTVAVVKSTPDVPAVRDIPAAFDDNDISLRDIYLPRINIVHNVGDLSAIFSPGEIVLNAELVIHTPAQVAKKIEGTPPLNITVLGFKRKQFAEKVKGGDRGLFVNSEAEVVANNGTLSYQEWQQSLTAENPAARKRYFEEYRTALILIEKPAHVTDDTNFIYECEGKMYALAAWGMKGTAFTHAAKHFFTARKIGALQKGGYPARVWTFTTELKKFGSNFAWVPVVRMTTPNSPAFLEFANTIVGA